MLKLIIRHTAYASLAILAACRLQAAVPLSNQEAFEKLLDAPSEQQVEIIKAVLEDSLAKRYVYNMGTRENAFDRLEEQKLVMFAPLLKRIAVMDYRAKEEFHETWNLVSISRALSALTKLGIPEAVDLNVKRLQSHSWIQSTAIFNLTILEEWEVTPEIENLFEVTEVVPDNLVVLRECVEFLAKSPHTTDGICPRLRLITSVFKSCFAGNPVLSFECPNLPEFTKILDERLGCGATPTGAK